MRGYRGTMEQARTACKGCYYIGEKGICDYAYIAGVSRLKLGVTGCPCSLYRPQKATDRRGKFLLPGTIQSDREEKKHENSL